MRVIRVGTRLRLLPGFDVLRVRDFRLLWFGGLVSAVGSWLLTIAIPAQVLQMTGSVRDAGLTLAAEYWPQLVLGPVAGVVADGWDRRRLMALASFASAAAVAMMLVGLGRGDYWVLYLALAAEAGAGVFYGPAVQARIPEVVGTGTLLSSASSLNATTAGVIRLLGGPLGGALFAVVGIRWLIGADVVSYLVAAGMVLMTTRLVARRTRAAMDVLADLAAGMRALRSSPAGRGLLAVQLAFFTANGALSAVLIPFGMQRLGGSTQTGLLMAALGIGFLLGAPLLRIVLDRVQPRHALAVSLGVTAVGYPAMFTTTDLYVVLPAAVILGLAGVITLSVPTTTVQRVTENAVLGRINSVFLSSAAAATLVGAITGPFLAQLLGLGGAAAVVGAVTMATAGMAWVIIPYVPCVSGRT